MILGIAGSRWRNTPRDRGLIRNRIVMLKPTMIVTTGIRTGHKIRTPTPDVFAKEIGAELKIPVKEFPVSAFLRPASSREQQIQARDLRRAWIGYHADYLLFLTHPRGKHGEIITAFHFMMYHNEYERWKNLEIL